MTPKEKAKELVDKFQKQIFFEITDERLDIEEAKGCALIALELTNEFADDSYRSCYGYKHTYEYLEQVKHEINKL
jgi:hypothetical protein